MRRATIVNTTKLKPQTRTVVHGPGQASGTAANMIAMPPKATAVPAVRRVPRLRLGVGPPMRCSKSPAVSKGVPATASKIDIR